MIDDPKRELRLLSEDRPVLGPPEIVNVEIWLRWAGNVSSLQSLVEPNAMAEKFTLMVVEPVEAGSPIWRAELRYIGRPIALDRQIESLLRRLSQASPWVKAVRHEASDFLDDES